MIKGTIIAEYFEFRSGVFTAACCVTDSSVVSNVFHLLGLGEYLVQFFFSAAASPPFVYNPRIAIALWCTQQNLPAEQTSSDSDSDCSVTQVLQKIKLN